MFGKRRSVLECFRKWRIITVALLAFMCGLSVSISNWFMALPSPNNVQGAFAGTTVVALVGAFKYWMETKANDCE